MKVQIKDAPKSQKEIEIELDYSVFTKAADEETAKIASTAKIPGFRAGKAPKDVVKKQNMPRIEAAAIEKVVGDAIRDALMDNKVNPMGQPQVSNLVFEEGKPISFTVHVDVYPEVEIKNYQGFSFERTLIKVDEGDIEDTINHLLDSQKEFAPIKKKRKVKDGDQALIDFEGKLDGVPFEGGTAQGHQLLIGSGQFIPGFEEQIIGMSIDETKDINVTFPADYHQADLAGKETVFTVTVHGIDEAITPELNDEFAKKISPIFESVAELREAAARDLQYEADQFVKYETFTKMLDKLAEENTFEVPAFIVDDIALRMANQNLQQYYRMGINPEQFGITAESMKPQFLEQAEVQAKHAIILGRLADAHKIGVFDEDINKEIERRAEILKRTAEDIKAEIVKQKQLDTIRNDILSDKVYNFLVEANTVHDTVLNRKDFEAKRQAEEDAKKAEDADADADKKPAKKASKKAKASEE